jgi:hypothetical protein
VVTNHAATKRRDAEPLSCTIDAKKAPMFRINFIVKYAACGCGTLLGESQRIHAAYWKRHR